MLRLTRIEGKRPSTRQTAQLAALLAEFNFDTAAQYRHAPPREWVTKRHSPLKVSLADGYIDWFFCHKTKKAGVKHAFEAKIRAAGAEIPRLDATRRTGGEVDRVHGGSMDRGNLSSGILGTRPRDRDLGSYVADAQKAVASEVQFPPGYYATWSGQFEYLERAEARLKIVVPVTLLIIFLLLYLNFRRITETLIVMLSVPFALVGGFWLMWWLGFNFSVAVAVGFIALAGVAAETGVIMLIYLDHALTELKGAAPLKAHNSRGRISTPPSCQARSSGFVPR